MADLGPIAKLHNQIKAVHGGTISGTVHNAAGANVSRCVVAFSRATKQASGGAISDPATGNYSILTNILNKGQEHFVVEFDSGYESQARVIDRIIPL